MSPIFFVHIPKTAGTSFRKACEAYFGVRHVAYDYSKSSPETAPFIKNVIYGDGDFLEFSEYMKENEVKFLCGHVPATKYLHLMGVANTIVFLRDPVQRVISEYHHFVTHKGYDKDFRTFYTTSNYINRFLRWLKDVPLTAIGFIGLTEKYENSLHQINHFYNLNIHSLELNRGPEEKNEISKEMIEEIESLNEEDVRLYNNAKNLLNVRSELFKKGYSFVHGEIQNVKQAEVVGWAWYSSAEQPVEVQVTVNGEIVGMSVAKDLRPGLLRISPPRKGYVGFKFKFSNPLRKGDVVECWVAQTGQSLGQHTFSS